MWEQPTKTESVQRLYLYWRWILERAKGRKRKVHERRGLKFSAPWREPDRGVECIFQCAKQDAMTGSCLWNAVKLALITNQRINTERRLTALQSKTNFNGHPQHLKELYNAFQIPPPSKFVKIFAWVRYTSQLFWIYTVCSIKRSWVAFLIYGRLLQHVAVCPNNYFTVAHFANKVYKCSLLLK